MQRKLNKADALSSNEHRARIAEARKDYKPVITPKPKSRPDRICEYNDTQLKYLVDASILNARARYRIRDGAEQRVYQIMKSFSTRNMDFPNEVAIDLLKSSIYIEIDGPVV